MTHLWTPAPLAIAHPSLFTANELDAFEREILTNPSATERTASAFFSKYPNFLCLGQGAEVRREVILLGDSDRPTQRVDFFRRSYGQKFWDIVEIKHPHVPFVVHKDQHHPRESSAVTDAIRQAQDYRRLITENTDVRAELIKMGILVYRPQIIVVVGRHPNDIPEEILANIFDQIRSMGPIEAWTYDCLYEFAKEHCKSGTRIVVATHCLVSTEAKLVLPESRSKREPRQRVAIAHVTEEQARFLQAVLDEVARLVSGDYIRELEREYHDNFTRIVAETAHLASGWSEGLRQLHAAAHQERACRAKCSGKNAPAASAWPQPINVASKRPPIEHSYVVTPTRDAVTRRPSHLFNRSSRHRR